MKSRYRVGCIALLLSVVGMVVQAEEMNITLSFAPSVADPSNNKLVNTTPVSGYCTAYPAHCGEHFSVVSRLTISDREFLRASESGTRRYWTYQGLDSHYKTVVMRHRVSGETREVQFRINLLAQRFYRSGGMGINFQTAGAYPPAGCGATIGYGDANSYAFAWKHQQGVRVCAKTIGESSQTPRSLNVHQISFGYEVISPDPLKMMNGVWEGTLSYTVGNNQQIDFGQGVYSDNILTFNITATVQHQFDAKLPPGNERVVLSPPGGWDKYINFNQLPARLQRDVPLWVTSSGPFTVSMSCEHYSGPNCGIASKLDGTIVPIRVGITLPGVESGSVAANNVELGNRLRHPMQATQYNNMKLSHLHFSADADAVRKMAEQRGTPWQGAVTVVFDANL